MKQMTLLLMTFTLFTQATLAGIPNMPIPEPTIISTQLVDLQINQEWLDNATSGSIDIDRTNSKLKLELYAHRPCPINMACIMVLDQILDLEVKLTTQYVDRCGAKHYLGEKDKTPDGLKETVHVIDYSMITCEIAVPNMTEVQYTTYNPWTNITTSSYLGGNDLSPMPVIF